MAELLRLAAFTLDPAGGNPAGVWLGETLPADAEMQRIAADVGYSETAFLVPDGTPGGGSRIRYFSPAAEVAFCGHATIATGVALAERRGIGRFELLTNGGLVPVETVRDAAGVIHATLTSVEPRVWAADGSLVDSVLWALGWARGELDDTLPPGVAYVGGNYLVLAVAGYETLRTLDYDFEALRSVTVDAELTTVQLVWREATDRFRARNPFPVGGVVEDPATGAAAAALGAYLRWRGELTIPARFTISQGIEMGRPSLIQVDVVDAAGGIRVTGTAVAIPVSG